MSPRLVACDHCDYLHTEEEIPPGHVARCVRCGSPLYQSQNNSIERSLAFAFTALMLFILANSFPILQFSMEGRSESNTLISGVLTFWNEGFWFLAFMVGLTSILAPLLLILAYIYVLLPLRFGLGFPAIRKVWRILAIARPWSMLDVFLIGLLVALTKLNDFADVIAGPAFYAVCILIPMSLLMSAQLDPREVWHRLAPRGLKYPTTDDIAVFAPSQERWVTCEVCAFVLTGATARRDHAICPCCGARVHHRKPASLSRAWALLISAAIFYIPANVFPIMSVTMLGRTEADTILSGVGALIEAGEWPIAMVVFCASIVVPIFKLVVLSWVYMAAGMGMAGPLRQRTRIYRITELIGRWSMIDVFMVSILAALVKLGNIATVVPGFGAVAFCAVVILTMLSAMAFDPRLIWDRATQKLKQGTPS
ncbi:paraquat-inducible protein A [Thalassospira mesophila]|uniref:Paraquat-inducible protein A n=1 Tax=Thalassospira mesophila TaxID=1293891 RepID=A0A1Y2L170_9PROT|nr:paraquat-inducible protein A [Thalassospira mesophila]OSQ38979.1 paraquat-inducible protein A [Thalassospira mesophila]